MVSWIDQNLAPVLDVFEWPFTFLFRNFVNGPEHHPWWEIADMPWIAVCVVFLVIGWFTRNLRVGVSVALALALCGILGTEYWKETVITLGIIIVAVALCAIIGIPLGILCGRFDGAWNVVRPVLDAMQVVHPFIYMLPIIFFFGIGAEPATMVTMVFALPPLIRLTNLGIRQVPSDVVEAARAYGASEGRVLRDVQLPLARPAIMTGLNQTLLLSISMLGIAAIMASGGLGRPVFQAVQNLDTAQAASSGLALFIVAVVLDRISQTEASDGEYLLTRIRKAWRHRVNPEALLPEAATIGAVAATEAKPCSGRQSPSAAAQRWLWRVRHSASSRCSSPGAPIPALISGYGRLVDQDLSGRELQRPGGRGRLGLRLCGPGLQPAGGRLGAGDVAEARLGCTLARGRRRPGVRPRRARLGGRLSLGHTARSQRRLQRRHRRLAGADRHRRGNRRCRVLAAGRPVHPPAPPGHGRWPPAGSWGSPPPRPSWSSPASRAGPSTSGPSRSSPPSWPRRSRSLRRQAEEDPASASEATLKMTALINEAQRTEKIVTDGFTSRGPRFGYLAIIVAAAGVACALLASGLFGHDERRKWIWSTATAGAATGVTMIAFNWIGSLTRVADAKLVSGAGAFLCLMAGLMLLARRAPC